MEKRARSGFKIMSSLVGLLKPLSLQMSVAIITGVLGFLLSFVLGVGGVFAILTLLKFDLGGIPFGGYALNTYLTALGVSAFLRSILHYVEQYFNHLIAFKILALIRGKVFEAMRNLAPAKLEQKNPGQLISMIMGDIELLEVFYAHTFSPICITVIVTVLLQIFYWQIHPLIALTALFIQILVGVLVPIRASKKADAHGVSIRRELGELNGEFLDKLKGIDRTIQFKAGDKAQEELRGVTEQILSSQKRLSEDRSQLFANIESGVILLSTLQLGMAIWLRSTGEITPAAAIVATMLTVSSFAPYIALANLGNTLSNTLACGDRILNLLAEEPAILPKTDGVDLEGGGEITCQAVDFTYPDDKVKIIDSLNLTVKEGEILGIVGESGEGKSTLLKLIMRFWDVDRGEIYLAGNKITDINTESLYRQISYMTQKTVLFAGTIRENLLIAKPDATDEELYEALGKASLDTYVAGLGKGLDETVGELGANFSGGERQRLGLARAFLAGRPVFMLDEPTSNLDSINNAIILKALKENAHSNTVILVSHQKSTLSICDRIVELEASQGA